MIAPAAFDAALLRLSRPHVLQTSHWAALKAPVWVASRRVWGDAETPLAATSLLARRPGRLPLRLLYAPKGPVVSPDLGHWDLVLADLEAEARRQKAIFVKIDPDIEAESDLGKALRQRLQQRGWRFSAEQIQFRNTVLSDLTVGEEAILAGMKQKTRYNLRLAERKGVTVGPSDDFESFYRLYAETAARDGFLIRPRDYYLAVMGRMQAAGLGQLLLAEAAGERVAGVFLLRFGPTAWYFYGASSSQSRDLMPNYLLQWQAMRWAREQGCTTYDWWGAPDQLDAPDRMAGVYRFKEGFGPRFTAWIGAWDFAPSPSLYRGYTQAMPRLLAFMRRRAGATQSEG